MSSTRAPLTAATVNHRNQDATCYVGNLTSDCTEPLLLELFTQAATVKSVFMPKDKLTGLHNNYGFVEFNTSDEADYAIQIMNMLKVHGKPLRVNKSASATGPNNDGELVLHY